MKVNRKWQLHQRVRIQDFEVQQISLLQEIPVEVHSRSLGNNPKLGHMPTTMPPRLTGRSPFGMKVFSLPL